MTRLLRRPNPDLNACPFLWVLFAWVGVVVAGPLESAAQEPHLESGLIFPLSSHHNHAPGIAELAGGELIVS